MEARCCSSLLHIKSAEESKHEDRQEEKLKQWGEGGVGGTIVRVLLHHCRNDPASEKEYVSSTICD